MNRQQKNEHRTRSRATEGKADLRLRPLAAWVLASLAFGAFNPAWAADDQSVAELQAEVARLRAALQKSGQQQAAAAPSQGQADTAAPGEKAEVAVGNQLDAVVVRRKQPIEKVQEVTKSVSLVSGEELERLDATNITEVLRRVGNVQFNYGNPRTGSLTMRGITTGSSDQIDPSVGVLLDGVSLGYTPLVNGYIFVDIDTADVSRGPQGTTGGKQSTVGRVSFTTKAPTFTPEAEASLTFGEWNTVNTTAIAGGPIVDGLLAWRGTFRREQADGPWTNQFPDLRGRSSYQNVDRTFGRVQFLLTPTSDFSAKLSVERQPKGSEFVNGLAIRAPEPTTFSDGVARPLANVDKTYKTYLRPWFNNDSTLWNTARDYYTYPVNVDNNGAIITGSWGETLNLNWKVAGHEIQSITGHRQHWFSASNDEGTPFDVTKSGGYITNYRQISQEFKLLSEKGKIVDYQGGLYYLSTDNDSLNRTRYGNDAGAYYASDAAYASLAATATGQSLLRDSANYAYKTTQTFVQNKTEGIYAKADWHLTEPTTLSTGYRYSHEDRRTSQGVQLADAGVGADLTTAFGYGTGVSNILNTAAATAAADRLAARYFGAGTTYSSLSQANKNLLRDAARTRNTALSLASPSSLYDVTNAPSWSGGIQTMDLTLSHKLNDNLTLFGSAQYGEKGGMSQIAANGTTSTVEKEKLTGYEVGFRAADSAKTLFVNANAFINDIKNFQSTVYVENPLQTAVNQSQGNCTGTGCTAYQSIVGNLPGVRVKGLELDAAYAGVKNFTFRLAGAYNDARYSKDTILAFPNERDTTGIPASAAYYNAKGQVLNNAPKYTGKLGVDYRQPVFGDKVFHATANYAYSSSYQISPSVYDKMPAFGILDLGVGIGRRDGLFDVNLIAKNALNEDAHNPGWGTYTPRLPRWIGVTFSTKL